MLPVVLLPAFVRRAIPLLGEPSIWGSGRVSQRGTCVFVISRSSTVLMVLAMISPLLVLGQPVLPKLLPE